MRGKAKRCGLVGVFFLYWYKFPRGVKLSVRHAQDFSPSSFFLHQTDNDVMVPRVALACDGSPFLLSVLYL